MNDHVKPPTLPGNPVDIKTRIDQFIALRDIKAKIKKRHKEELKPYSDMMEVLEGILLAELRKTGLDSMSGSSGTAYRNTKRSATIADAEAFRRFVISSASWDIVDWRANAPAVRDYIESAKAPPPGVNYTEETEIGVRRK